MMVSPFFSGVPGGSDWPTTCPVPDILTLRPRCSRILRAEGASYPITEGTVSAAPGVTVLARRTEDAPIALATSEWLVAVEAASTGRELDLAAV